MHSTSFPSRQVMSYMLSLEYFASNRAVFFCNCGLSDIFLRLFRAGYPIVHSFTSFDISRSRLCRGSIVNIKYMLYLGRSFLIHPGKVSNEIATGFYTFASHGPKHRICLSNSMWNLHCCLSFPHCYIFFFLLSFHLWHELLDIEDKKPNILRGRNTEKAE